MPGMSFVCGLRNDIDKRRDQVQVSLNALLHSNAYKCEQILASSSYMLACTRYSEYPTAFFENNTYSIYLEGWIYGKKPTSYTDELFHVADWLVGDTAAGNERITQWLLETNGEFVLLARDKKSER